MITTLLFVGVHSRKQWYLHQTHDYADNINVDGKQSVEREKQYLHTTTKRQKTIQFFAEFFVHYFLYPLYLSLFELFFITFFAFFLNFEY